MSRKKTTMHRCHTKNTHFPQSSITQYTELHYYYPWHPYHRTVEIYHVSLQFVDLAIWYNTNKLHTSE